MRTGGLKLYTNLMALKSFRFKYESGKKGETGWKVSKNVWVWLWRDRSKPSPTGNKQFDKARSFRKENKQPDKRP